MRSWKLKGYYCAPEIVNGMEEKRKKFLKHYMLNETFLWMLIGMATKTSVKLLMTITFPCKQTIIKHDMN